MLKIRKFEKEDAEKLSRLIRKNLKKVVSKEAPWIIVRFWNFVYSPVGIRILSKKREIYVAAEGRKIVGTASLRGKSLEGVYVDVKFRGKGIGKKLVRHIEKVAKKKGYEKIKALPLTVSVTDYYKKLGYREVFRLGILIVIKKKL